MLYDEHVNRISPPTQLVVMKSPELNGPILVDIDLPFAFAAIDRLLGGPGSLPPNKREPTSIERGLIAQIANELIPAFNEAWQHLADLQITIAELALSAALLRIAAPSEVVAVLRFEVRVSNSGRTAQVSICFPHAALEPLLPRLSASTWYATGKQADEAWSEDLDRALQSTPITVRAMLGTVEISVEELASLAVGDIIKLDERADQPILLTIADAARGLGIPGRSGEHLAVKIVAPFQPVEE